MLRPITVLVGENSSGKTTFLGLVHLAWTIGMLGVAPGRVRDVSFNVDPFSFGSYDQIATFRGGRGGLARAFSIGAKVSLPHLLGARAASVVGTFADEHGQASLDQWAFEAGAYRAWLKPRDERLRIETPNGALDVSGPRANLFTALRAPTFAQDLDFMVSGEIPRQDLNAWNRLFGGLRGLRSAFGQEPYAFAPIRTKPQRTYDPIADEARPEGSHVPVVLARMVGSDPDAWTALRKALDDFGRASGLFDLVDVRRMGRKDSDPFQVRVKLTGPAFNLVDVGYGVSQVLPILVDCTRDKRPRTFLLQQPEVHLHPRAQAALGTWLAALAKTQNKRFVVETHSDHLVDRLRMDVRDRKYLKPTDVAILYFERRRGATHIRHLELDERGNFKEVSDDYRSFFLEEERRMLAG